MRNLLFFVTLASSPILALCQSESIVITPLGHIKGKIYTSRKKWDFYSFRGVRYAEPPVGNLRFKPPVPVKPWEDIYDATKDGPACMQGYWDEMSEDCLRLNIYTHHLDADALRPVLFFIHGGEFEYFTSQSEWLGPEYLMDQDIVVVTINYRLGVLGFFSTGDEHAPGNYGMKDQVEALKWVQNNILPFGGDPNKVTIAGFEAGAASVIFHLLSPMSRGLFHGAIAMSASALNNWTITRDPLLKARQLAASLNCPVVDSQSMVDCMRELPATNVTFSIYELIYALRDHWDEEPFAVLTPVIEFGNDEDEKFLPEDPLKLLKEGNVADVPLMIGTTRDEMAYKARILLYSEELCQNLSTNWNDLAPEIFNYDYNDEISQMVREFYLGSPNEPVSRKVSVGLEQLYADSFTIFGVIRTAKLVSDKNTQPVFLYQYNYDRKLLVHEDEVHENLITSSDDATLIIRTRFMAPVDESKKDAQCADKLITLWKNFMETGNPTPGDSKELDNVIWTPFKTTDPSYLDINETLTVKKGIYYEGRMVFWENLFPL